MPNFNFSPLTEAKPVQVQEKVSQIFNVPSLFTEAKPVNISPFTFKTKENVFDKERALESIKDSEVYGGIK